MRYLFSSILAVTIMACSSEKENTTIEIGVSKELAKQRKEIITNTSYDLYFDIPISKDDDIKATTTISFELNNASSDLQIDFKEDREHLLSIVANTETIPITFINEHIIIDSKYLLIGENEITIDFIAGNLSLNRNDDYLYTLLVPDRARTVFPLFDQPDIKAAYQLTLDIPAEWKALSNGPALSDEPIDDKRRFKFGRTMPISSYLFAFTAGKYKEAVSKNGDMTILYRETDLEKTEINIPQIFELHQTSINWLQDYTQIDYPFQKFDFALIPGFQYGGMEHPGAIFYNERSLMLDRDASINRELSRASLIAHETAHMWFGDLVTMKWFDDVWLKEVFANFMAAKIINPTFPDVDHELRFLLSHYPRAYSIDRSKGSHPIQQDLPNLNAAGSLYGAIIYQKAPIIMQQLEKIIGKEKFQEGLQEYLETYSFDNAIWDDLISIMQKKTEKDLEKWNTDWVKSPGMPEIDITIEKSNTKMQVAYVLANDTSDQTWSQNIHLITGSGEKKNLYFDKGFGSAYMDNGEAPFHYNVNGEAYGYIAHPPEVLHSFLSTVNKIDHAPQRAATWILLWEELLRGRLNKRSYLGQIISSIDTEKNPLILNYTLSHLRQIFWNFLEINERKDNVKTIEDTLWNKIQSEDDSSIKRNLFNTYVSIVTTEEGIRKLIDIIEKSIPSPISLSNRDKEKIILELAVRDEDPLFERFDSHASSLTNNDDSKRMNFIKPALSSDKVVRDQFFNSLTEEENREQERWVLTALEFLHHPLRQDDSREYLPQSLELLEEIQRTGDIFFPKRWLDVTIGQYSDPESVQIIEDYLVQHPDLSPNLVNKVHQSADLLYRAQTLYK